MSSDALLRLRLVLLLRLVGLPCSEVGLLERAVDVDGLGLVQAKRLSDKLDLVQAQEDERMVDLALGFGAGRHRRLAVLRWFAALRLVHHVLWRGGTVGAGPLPCTRSFAPLKSRYSSPAPLTGAVAAADRLPLAVSSGASFSLPLGAATTPWASYTSVSSFDGVGLMNPSLSRESRYIAPRHAL